MYHPMIHVALQYSPQSLQVENVRFASYDFIARKPVS